jgi:hypothetical protein
MSSSLADKFQYAVRCDAEGRALCQIKTKSANYTAMFEGQESAPV